MGGSFRFLRYRSAEEAISVNAVVRDETVWLTQKAMAELFGCNPDNLSLHLKYSSRVSRIGMPLPRKSRQRHRTEKTT